MNLRRAAAVFAAVAVALLVAAEFTTVFEVTVGPLEIVKRRTTGGANHGYALLFVALFAVALALHGLRAAGRAAGVGLIALGSVVLVVALAVDLPDTRGSGRLPESLAYEDARARAGLGLGLELAGGVLLVAAGGLLALGAGSRRRGDSEGAGSAGARERPIEEESSDRPPRP
ncbi:MAG TPA: hypothetical protein VGR11_03020 [Solirubrobacteraceae bacterium]|nr:hypothetical protein [Solirubrobacteraceae bacterium]